VIYFIMLMSFLPVYIGSVSVSLSLSLFALPLLVVSSFIMRNRIQFYKELIFLIPVLLWFFYYIFNNLFFEKGVEGIWWWLVLVIATVFLGRLRLVHELKFSLFFSFLVLIVDVYVRFSQVDYSAFLNNYYVAKKGSIVGVDSNVSGLFALLCLVLLLASRKYLSKIYFSLMFVIGVTLLVLSLSKAAVLAGLVLVLYSYLNKKFFLAAFVVSIPIICFLVSLQESGLSKYQLLISTGEFVENAGLADILIGSGVNNFFFSALGLNPHILYLQLFLYFGVFGVIFYSLVWVGLFALVGRSLFILFIPYMVVSLSFTPLIFPPLCYAMLFFVRYKEELR